MGRVDRIDQCDVAYQEVIGFSDVLHMGQVQVGMEEPFRLGQGKCVELKSKSRSKIITLQIDGEPLEFITPF